MADLHLSATIDPRVNLAAQQNGVPVVSSIALENRSDEVLSGVEVQVTMDPPIGGWSARIDAIEPGATHTLRAIDLTLSTTALREQAERVRGTLTVRASHDGAVLAEHVASTEVLAANEWPGVDRVPELLAAFVSPNDPSIATLLPAVAATLGELTGNDALDGYQSRDPQRIAHLAAAVYAVLQQRGLRYIAPPASFEKTGQKIRRHEHVLSGGMGTCLDLTVLMAAVLEQCGVHPVMVAAAGHAFPGVWLTEFSLKEPFHDDPLPLRKRVDLAEALVFDSSSVAQGRPFDQAVETAQKLLQNTPAFRFVVDVRAARAFGIRPLPLDGRGDDLDLPEPEGHGRDVPTRVVDLAVLEDAPTGPIKQRDRVDRWKDKLLDLTLRNSLLNFRPGKKSAQLLPVDVAAIEDQLSAGEALAVVPRPSLSGARDEGLVRTQAGVALDDAWIQARWSRGELVANHTDQELGKRLLELYRHGRSAMLETGTISVYLAIGVMRWRQSPADRERRAPLLLVPVTLERGSGSTPYRIRGTEDDTRVNVTLLKYLAKDHGVDGSSLDELPITESGVDVPRVLNRFRLLVKDLPNWEVVEEAWIAPFTFTKFLMWLDLDANVGDLLQNDVVKQIFDGGDREFPVAEPFLSEADLDARRRPQDLLTVLDADPTQLSAIVGVSQGNSFVLQGPPGTGKSQTITNLIAQALAEGRSVLFVSQKMAALEVVHRRLSKVGLGPFCLELHSHKATKKSVVDQLRAAMHASTQPEPEGWAAVASDLQAHRDRLNRTAAALRAPSGFGPSVHGALSALIGLRDAPRSDLKEQPLTQDRWQQVGHALRDLELAAAQVPAPEAHPWRGVARTEWSPRWARALLNRLSDLVEATDEVTAAADAMRALWDLEPTDDVASLAHLDALAQALLTSPNGPLALVTGNQAAVEASIAESCAVLNERQVLWADLSQRYDEDLLRDDLGGLHAAFKQWANAFFVFAFFMLWSSRSRMKAWARTALASNPRVLSDLEHARRVQALDQRVASASAATTLGPLWRGLQSDPKQLQSINAWAGRARAAVLKVAPHPAQSKARAQLHTALTTEATVYQPGTPAGTCLQQLRDAYAAFRSALKGAELELGPLGTSVSAVRTRATEATAASEALAGWCSWMRAAKTARALGLGPAVDAAEVGQVRIDSIGPSVRRALLQDWWETHLEGDPTLARFQGVEHEQVIERFCALEQEWTQLVQQLIRARIAKRIPHADVPGEMKVLKRELQKRRGHKPPRVLFKEIPTILRTVKPCMLMSPLSVAKYVDAAGARFDLVVFDEASQIPPWDAVGAIARGDQVVVVGDSQQLPPTSFFTRDDDPDDDDEQDLEDLESILDEAIAARLPQLRLGWHYRSRHESLIAFSNHHYYQNTLNTFPSPEESMDGLGVQFRRVIGHYDRGGSRTNKTEAQAVVDEVVSRLSDLTTSSASIGIVTFNSQQQRLIEDLLDVARSTTPAIEIFFTDAVLEPVFIKNLENVQGDERDVMIFSICYGPDAGGRVSMNFGPLNRRGGERRLNVAITRAREQLIVMSTLTADQIRLSATRSVGVRHLRAFLDYAQRGPIAIREAVQVAATDDTESPFEEEVRQVLSRMGWEVHPQVGCSGYRVDLGVVDPERPGRYLIGIECDGAAYHSSANARARDRQRQGVLEQLGWTIHRVWSTDWWHRQGLEIERLQTALAAAQVAPQRAPPRTNDAAALPEVEPDLEPDAPVSEREAVGPPQPDTLRPYRDVGPLILGTRERFYLPSTLPQIRARLESIVQVEGPIHTARAARLVTASWGMARVGGQIRGILEQAVEKSAGVTVRGDFYWLADVDPDLWDVVRAPGNDRRSPHEIPAEEWANAALAVVRSALAIGRAELAREAARWLGFSQLGKKVRVHAEQGVDALVSSGAVSADEARVWL